MGLSNFWKLHVMILFIRSTNFNSSTAFSILDPSLTTPLTWLKIAFVEGSRLVICKLWCKFHQPWGQTDRRVYSFHWGALCAIFWNDCTSTVFSKMFYVKWKTWGILREKKCWCLLHLLCYWFVQENISSPPLDDILDTIPTGENEHLIWHT